MIKTETKGNSIHVLLKGERDQLAAELSHTLANGAITIGGEDDKVEAMLFATLMTAIDILAEKDIKIDKRHLALCIKTEAEINISAIVDKIFEEIGKRGKNEEGNGNAGTAGV